MRELAVTAVGADRPGIVAAISGALLRIGGNLEDARAALLRGSFATVLAVAVPDDVSPADVAAALRPVADELGLGLWVGEAAPKASGPSLPRCVVSAYGADRPGIVHGLATALAERGVNVVDLSARLVGDPPIYAVGVEVEMPAGVAAAALEADLRSVAGELGVELTVAPEEDEVL